VTQADTDLGSIYDLAQKHFNPANTVFFYTSDHGAQWPFGKWNLYDSGIRVPFLAAWPGVIKPNTQSDAMVQWIDIIPTIIDIVGGMVPGGIDGRSFANVLRGTAATHRTEIFTTHSGDGDKNVYPIRSLRTGEFKYILNLLPDKAHTTHIDRGAGSGDGWRYFDEWVASAKTDASAATQVRAYHQRPGEELYDLNADPNELHNLADDPNHITQLTSMRDQLEAWMKSQGDQRTVFDKPHALDEPYPTRPTSEQTEAPKAKKKGKAK
jgi:arylsulfatase A-like enzyme